MAVVVVAMEEEAGSEAVSTVAVLAVAREAEPAAAAACRSQNSLSTWLGCGCAVGAASAVLHSWISCRLQNKEDTTHALATDAVHEAAWQSTG